MGASKLIIELHEIDRCNARDDDRQRVASRMAKEAGCLAAA